MNEAGVLFRPTEDFIYAISRTELDLVIQTASEDVSEIFLEYGKREEEGGCRNRCCVNLRLLMKIRPF